MRGARAPDTGRGFREDSCADNLGLRSAITRLCMVLGAYGWLSKLWSLFGVPIITRHLLFRVPQKGP